MRRRATLANFPVKPFERQNPTTGSRSFGINVYDPENTGEQIARVSAYEKYDPAGQFKETYVAYLGFTSKRGVPILNPEGVSAQRLQELQARFPTLARDLIFWLRENSRPPYRAEFLNPRLQEVVAPRMMTGKWKVASVGAWHMTRREYRESILEHGLDWRKGRALGNSPYHTDKPGVYQWYSDPDSERGQPWGNYFVQSPEQAQSWMAMPGDQGDAPPDELFDLWYVNVDLINKINDDQLINNAFSTPDVIPPEALTLIATGDEDYMVNLLLPRREEWDNPVWQPTMEHEYFFTGDEDETLQ